MFGRVRDTWWTNRWPAADCFRLYPKDHPSAGCLGLTQAMGRFCVTFAFHTWKMLRIGAFFDVPLDYVAVLERTLPLGLSRSFNASIMECEERALLEKEREPLSWKVMFNQGGKEAKGLIEFLPEKKRSAQPWGPALEEGQGSESLSPQASSAAHTRDSLKNSKSPAQLLCFKKHVANNLSIISWFRDPGTRQFLLF